MNRRSLFLFVLGASCTSPHPSQRASEKSIEIAKPVVMTQIEKVKEVVDPELVCATKLLNLDIEKNICTPGHLSCEEILMTPVTTCDVE